MSFVDSEFSAGDDSLYQANSKKDGKVVSWRRPVEFAKQKPELFVEGTSAGDVKQGALGDCWFLGALSVVATRDDLLKPIFKEADVEAGRYVVRFFKEGEWHDITVDDYLPCTEKGVPAYAQSADLHEVWVMIVEKAYAKLHGSYAALEGGNVSEGLVDLTGGAPEEIDLPSPKGQEMIQNGELWKRLKHFVDEKWLMGCGYVVEGGGIEEDRGNGILQNHAYGLMDVVECEGHKLLKMRNPWGEKEWTGAWSDGSSQWTEDMKKKLNFEFADDGVFWMEFDDFVKNMNKVYVCRLYEDKFGKQWQKTTIRNRWEGKNAGGSINYESWFRNPQYHLKVTKPDTDLYVCISQPDIRQQGKMHSNDPLHNYENKIGFYILNTTDPTIKLTGTLTNDDVAVKMTYLNLRQVAVDCKLEPGQDYILMPSTFEPNIELEFVLEVFADEDISLTEIADSDECEIHGEWKGKTAGGCLNHPTWKNNPQYRFYCNKPVKLNISIIQELAENEEANYVGMLLFHRENDLRVLEPVNELWKSDITNARQVGGVVQLEASEDPYIVVPSTFDPNQNGKFKILLQGTPAPSAPNEVKEWCTSSVKGEWRGKTAGGCPNHLTWRDNTQYVLNLKSDFQRLTITLSAKGAGVGEHVGLYVFKHDAMKEGRKLDLLEGDVAAKSDFMTTEATVTVEFGRGAGPYVLLPCTFNKGVECDFEVTIASEVAVELTPLPQSVDHSAAVRGQWSGSKAGGCTNHPTWVDNPKHVLRVGGAAPVHVLLTQDDQQNPKGFGFMLTKADSQLLLESVVGESQLTVCGFVKHTFDSLSPNTDYYILPVTFDKGVEMPYDIHVYSKEKVTLSDAK